MQPDSFIEKIKWYWYYRRELSLLLLANITLLAFLGDAFFSVFFFSFLLFFAGNIFVQKLGNAKMFVGYGLGLLLGILAFIAYAGYEFVFTEKIMWRAAIQSAVWSLLITAAVCLPNYNIKVFVFPAIKLKYAAIVFVVLNLLSIEDPEIYLAHLAGCLAGIAFGFTQTSTFKGILKTRKHRKARMKAEYNPQKPLNDDEYNAIKAMKQKQIDSILDKISKNGYESLTKEEKDFLFKFGK